MKKILLVVALVSLVAAGCNSSKTDNSNSQNQTQTQNSNSNSTSNSNTSQSSSTAEYTMSQVQAANSAAKC